ncbi:CDP-diacylglycerol--glycerol-3-phosphate 3-phosphatidyltransferase, mitochondrial [Folsomia candida]|uniref:CDP-diacylglycerol--glycerol-3-phosphate 3-phosphatidyltransferase, mitochondrial n=1 Tax=Folsomia candida TaxID=158441 RepID=UPI000B900F80|nr:CDP-diacylglycerol--glycerol-3-phosphate 3-phosphatidyltransferase, mitochondrial [Folsomia candida]
MIERRKDHLFLSCKTTAKLMCIISPISIHNSFANSQLCQAKFIRHTNSIYLLRKGGGILQNSSSNSYCRSRLTVFVRRRMSTSGRAAQETLPSHPPPSLSTPPISPPLRIHDDNPQKGQTALHPTPVPGLHPAKVTLGPSNKPEEEFFDDEKAFLSSWEWLLNYGPGFPVSGGSVKIIHSPDKFYSTLLEKAKKATRRVSLASLYLGSGPQELELVQALEENGASNKNLKIKVLLDFTRGSRGLAISSRTMLLPLISKCYDCQVFLYHTPQLRGLKKRFLPQRWNEIIGLQHMKIYIFDDSIIISGANLSADYFTNRQDRYFMVENCKELADFYDQLIDRVSDFSFQLEKTNSVALKPDWKVHPSEGNLQEFVEQAKQHVLSFYDRYKQENVSRLKSYQSAKRQDNSKPTTYSNSNLEDTWIFPLIQMGGIGISLDKNATCQIFENSPQGSFIKLATGYFNLTTEYIDKIIKNSSTNYEILMAHPKANGFFGAKGFAGGIPAAYTLLAKQFLDNADYAKQMYRLSMREYLRDGWTYHAKGLWYYPPNRILPAATLIGSPNFGHRSVYRDLETQLYLVTINPMLQEQLEEEQRHLFSFSKPFVTTELSQPNRVVPLWVRMVIKLFRNFF